MIAAIILTFIITALSMMVFFLAEDGKKQAAEKHRMAKENDGLRRQISEYASNEQRRRENSAYDRGLYDGRTTDVYYRQCLKKFTTRDQTEIILNGAKEENEDYA